MSKAQATILDFLIATLLSISVLLSIYSISYSIYRKWLYDELKAELRLISFKVSSEIVKGYGIAKQTFYVPKNFSAFLIYEKELELPSSLKGRSYEIFFTNPNPVWITITNVSFDGKIKPSIKTGGIKVVGRIIQENLEVELSLPNLDLVAGGKIESGGKNILRYYRVNLNDELYDFVLIGNYNILAKVTNIR